MNRIPVSIHAAAPLSGPAFEVVRQTLCSSSAFRTQPISYQYLAPSSKPQYEVYRFKEEHEKKNMKRKLPDDGSVEGEDSSSTSLPGPSEPAEPIFKDIKEADQYAKVMFALGSIYTHVLNRAGHAVLKRLSHNDLNWHIEKGWYIRLFPIPKRFKVGLPKNRIVFDAPDFTVVDKPRGLPSVSTHDNFIENAVYLASEIVGLNLHPVHRLDTPTTGLLIMGKNPRAATELTNVWREGVQKYYSLIAHAENENVPDLPPPGSIVTHWMDLSGKTAPKPISFVRDDEKGFDKEASLVVESWEYLSPSIVDGQKRVFCKVRLLTGRTHQIRSQFALLGWPLEGDLMYRSGFDKDLCIASGIDAVNPPLKLRCYRVNLQLFDKKYEIQAQETEPEDDCKVELEADRLFKIVDEIVESNSWAEKKN